MNREQTLAFRIKCLHNQIRRQLDRTAIAENDANLTGMQYAILGFVDEWPGGDNVYQRDIEAEFNIRRSTASAMLRHLEGEGYLYREGVPGDARLKKIILTKKAEAVGKIAKESMEDLQKKMTGGIPEEELKQFCDTLDKILKNME